MKITFAEKAPKNSLYVAGVYEDANFGNVTKALDKLANGSVKAAVSNAEFKGKAERFLRIPSSNGSSGQVVLVGLGDAKKHTSMALEKIGAKLFACLNGLREKKAVIDVSDIPGVKNHTAEELVAYVASGALIRSWNFDKYKTKREKDEIPVLDE